MLPLLVTLQMCDTDPQFSSTWTLQSQFPQPNLPHLLFSSIWPRSIPAMTSLCPISLNRISPYRSSLPTFQQACTLHMIFLWWEYYAKFLTCYLSNNNDSIYVPFILQPFPSFHSLLMSEWVSKVVQSCLTL